MVGRQGVPGEDVGLREPEASCANQSPSAPSRPWPAYRPSSPVSRQESHPAVDGPTLVELTRLRTVNSAYDTGCCGQGAED